MAYMGWHIYVFVCPNSSHFCFFCCKVNKELYAIIFRLIIHFESTNPKSNHRMYARHKHQARRMCTLVIHSDISGHWYILVVISPEAARALGEQPFRSQRRTTVLKSL